jgi:hypothetical protein
VKDRCEMLASPADFAKKLISGVSYSAVDRHGYQSDSQFVFNAVLMLYI